MHNGLSIVDGQINNSRRDLPLHLSIAYGAGHVLNDVCAAIWFTYLLVYFEVVLNFNKSLSAALLLIGQVTDAVATPIVGIQSDKAIGCCNNRYGRRKIWHLTGTLLVIASFPFIFMPCFNCKDSSEFNQFVYYAFFVIVFQIGWACVQISHLSLIPDLTLRDDERTELTAVRYGFTVVSSIFIYITTWVVFHVTEDEADRVDQNDATKFRNIVLTGISIGAVFSIIFHIAIKEPTYVPKCHIANGQPCCAEEEIPSRLYSLLSLLRDTKFYQIALVYMASRLFINMMQIYIPLYLHDSLGMSSESLAFIPLLMFVSSFVVNLTIKIINRKYGRKWTFLLGGVIGILGCIWIRFGYGQSYMGYQIYVIAMLVGASSAIMLVTSLGLTADFIGTNTESGAFVYGAMSFVEKLSNGIIVIVIEAKLYKDLISRRHMKNLQSQLAKRI